MDTVAEQRFSSLASGKTAEGLILLNPEGCIIQLNASAERLLGYNSAELKGQSVWTLLSREEHLTVEFRDKTKVARYSVRAKSGGSIPVEVRFGPLLEEDELQLVFLHDLREGGPGEMLYKSYQTKLNALLEAIPDSIFIQDFDGNFLDYYPPLDGALFDADVVIPGRNMKELFPPELTKRFREAIAKIRKNRKAQHLEFSMGTSPETFYEARIVPMNNHNILSIVRDVSRAKAIQKVLEIRNRALEAAGNGIVVSDARIPDFPVIYSNKAFTEITGYTQEEIIGRNCRFLQLDDLSQPSVRRLKKALDKYESFTEVIRSYRKDGSEFWNELTLTPIEDGKGNVTHFIGVMSDVSQRIAESVRKDRVRDILRGITEDLPLVRTGESLAELMVAQTGSDAALISLYHPDTSELRSLASYGLPDDLKEYYERVEVVPTSDCPCGKAALERQVVIIKDTVDTEGRPQPCTELVPHGIHASWAFPVLSASREVLGTCTLYRKRPGEPTKEHLDTIREVLNLTGVAVERYRYRRQLEEGKVQLEAYARTLEERVEDRTREVRDTVDQLRQTNLSLQEQIQTTREAEARALANQVLFDAMARNFPNGVIMVIDTALNFVHLEGEEITGLGIDSWDYSGKSVETVPGFTQLQCRYLRRMANKTLRGEHLSFELEHEQSSYQVNSTPLKIDKEVRWALLVFSNITEQKSTERELVRALETEQELNDLKSRFMSMASHEFRTPLSAILSSAILIGKQNEAGSESKRERYIRQIKNNVRNLVVILDDFLSLSRLEEGEIYCQPSEFDLLSLLRSVLDELEANLKVGQHFSEECKLTDPMVFLDSKLTRQILVNLLSNAIKYSPENSEIHIGIHGRGDLVEVTIRDQGMGIPQEEHPQLFNRFYRARNAMNIPGTGLGLHIVRQYTGLMGGEIRFTSIPDKGSTFILNLPRTFKPINDETNTDR